MTGGPDGGRPYFGRARIAAGLILVSVACLLMFIDAFRTDYAVETVQLGLMFGSGLLLLGVEGAKKYFG